MGGSQGGTWQQLKIAHLRGSRRELAEARSIQDVYKPGAVSSADCL